MITRTQPRLITAGRLLAILLLSTALISHAPARRAYADGDDHIVGEVVVKLYPNSSVTIDDINHKYGTKTLRALMIDGAYLLRLPGGGDADDVLENLREDSRLQFVERNYIGRSPEANPSGVRGFGDLSAAPFLSQYASTMLGLEQAHAFNGGAGVTVAIVDTGVQLDHPELVDHLTPGYDFLDLDSVPEDEFNNLDDNGNGLVDEAFGHGTHIAGIVHLVAPDAMLMPLRVLNSDGDGDIFAVAEAIDYAVRNGANVINLSLGTDVNSRLLADTIDTAAEHDVAVVAAAGNANSYIKQYPAADTCAIAVTSIGPDDIKSSFANYGRWVDIAAPGESIYSTFPGGGYVYWSGTSMATPFVAGQFALVHSIAPKLKLAEMVAMVNGTAHDLDLLNPAYADRLGYGQADIAASLAPLAAGDFSLLSGQNSFSANCNV